MEIKEAVEYVRKSKTYIVSKNSIGGELIPPRITSDGMESIRTIENALKSGYTLCKVDEAVEKMDDLIEIIYADDSGTYKHGHTNGVSECIDIIKEACK